MNFSNKKVIRTFTSTDAKNAWANIESLGWRRIKPISVDGVENVFMMLNAAVASGRKVSGTTDNANQITALYLL